MFDVEGNFDILPPLILVLICVEDFGVDCLRVLADVLLFPFLVSIVIECGSFGGFILGFVQNKTQKARELLQHLY